MTTKNGRRRGAAEPLLNTVARTLGHAAGTLAKMTQEVTKNIASVPELSSPKKLSRPARQRRVQTSAGGSKKQTGSRRAGKRSR